MARLLSYDAVSLIILIAEKTKYSTPKVTGGKVYFGALFVEVSLPNWPTPRWGEGAAEDHRTAGRRQQEISSSSAAAGASDGSSPLSAPIFYPSYLPLGWGALGHL